MHRLLTRRDLYCYLAIPLMIYMAYFAVSALDKPSLQSPTLPAKTLTMAHNKPTLPDKTEEVTVPIPSLEGLATVLYEACEEYGVPVSLALAVMERESGFEVDAVNPSGCYGLMQLNPEYFPGGLTPAENIRAGVGYLGALLAKHESVAAAVTEYFWGPSGRTSSPYSGEVLERAEKWRGRY